MKMQNRTGFALCHPLVHMTYFLTIILLCMLCRLPVVQLMGMTAGICYIVRYQGRKGMQLYLWLGIPMAVYALIINPLFNHRGETALFYINQSPITLEMLLYGISLTLMVLTAAMWIGVMSAFLSSDRVYYLLGRISPRLALFFSMTLRLIPQLRKKYEIIHQGQIALGNIAPDDKLQRIRYLGKEFSILLSWSLEDSIETSDSMEARGYGLKGRTSYHLFQWKKTDGCLTAIILCMSAPVWFVIATGRCRIYYFPSFQLPEWDEMLTLACIAFLFLFMLPCAVDKPIN